MDQALHCGQKVRADNWRLTLTTQNFCGGVKNNFGIARPFFPGAGAYTGSDKALRQKIVWVRETSVRPLLFSSENSKFEVQAGGSLSLSIIVKIICKNV